MGAERYEITQSWVGNDGTGTSLPVFARDGELAAAGLATIPTNKLGGENPGWTPEHLLTGAVSQCHMLWFLYLCNKAGVTVTDYTDNAWCLLTTEGARGQVTEMHLNAHVTITAGTAEETTALFEKAGELCYVARTLNIPVEHEIVVTTS